VNILARLSFNPSDVERGIAALREAGYRVLGPHHDDDWPDFAFLEASRELDIAHAHGGELQLKLDAEFDRIDEIVGPLYGEIICIGPRPVEHEPFRAVNPHVHLH
jgi:hypothetical protein